MVDTVEVFPWNPNFATGIPLIDEQHRTLINLLNQLVSHLAYQSDAPTLNAVFDELKRYTAVHFSTEEAIWRQHFSGDPWESWHTQAHGDFIAEVIRLKQEGESQPVDDVIGHIVTFLTHWLAYHILESDKRMAKVVLALPTGVSLEHAKEKANAEMSGATRLLIETVMTMYDELASRTVQMTREINKRKKVEQELQRARERADVANQAKSAFLAQMSHEIRTPLNAITGMAYLMKREGVAPEQQERLTTIEHAGQHLVSVVNDILDLSKIEAGKFVLEKREVSVESLVENVASILADRAREKKLELIVACEPSPCRLLGDSTRLQQALLNYANNAVQFTDSGRIVLRTRNLEDSQDGVVVRFEVEDTGMGIEKSALDRLFRNFEQAGHPGTTPHAGTGLGLAITKKLAELMDGAVGVESTPGTGSTFWFTAKLQKDQSVRRWSEEVPEGPVRELLIRDFSGSRILVVEDEPVNREIAQILLEDAHLAVECAGDGEQALSMASAKPYALILMDMQLPRMDGPEAARRIRQLAVGHTVPIIAMTANAFGADKQRCLDAGMSDFLTKPVNPEELYAHLYRWLSRSGAAE